MEFGWWFSGTGKTFLVIPIAVLNSLDHDQDAFTFRQYHIRCIIFRAPSHEKVVF